MGNTDDVALSLRYEPEPATPRAARREFQRQFGTHPCIEALLLCVSEVVTNAVLHARTPLAIRASENGDVVRVEVTDGSRAQPIRRSFVEISPTGRGLHLLDRLTTSWGIEMTSSGKVVWFEVAPDAAP